jgi:hypothetical protein
MKRLLQHSIACAIAAIYSGIALLGPGLHHFDGNHGNHIGNHVVECSEHDHSHLAAHDHHADCELSRQARLDPADVGNGRSNTPSFEAGGCRLHSHACDVCHFLGQIRGAIVAQPLAIAHHRVGADALLIADSALLPLALGPQAPRGPPHSRG